MAVENSETHKKERERSNFVSIFLHAKKPPKDLKNRLFFLCKDFCTSYSTWNTGRSVLTTTTKKYQDLILVPNVVSFRRRIATDPPLTWHTV